jgi:ribonuclease P protein component
VKGRLRFPKSERLKRVSGISEVFKRGRNVSCPGARLFFIPAEGACNRIAFTFSRKFGNAVKRNRARRLGREAYRLLRGKLKTGFNMVLLVYPDEKSGLDSRLKQVNNLFEKAKLFSLNEKTS